MKKIILLLLLAAAGAALYYLFVYKKSAPATASVKHELLEGKWKLDSVSIHSSDSTTGPVISLLGTIDSNFYRYVHDVQPNGLILASLPGQAAVDTSYYTWESSNEIIVREQPSDSLRDRYRISLLTNDSLVFYTKDSTVFIFSKWKQ